MCWPLVLAALLATAGSPATVSEGRVRSALERAGISVGHSKCMARHMAGRLTIGQLRKLERVGRLPKGIILLYSAEVRRVIDAAPAGPAASAVAFCMPGLVAQPAITESR